MSIRSSRLAAAAAAVVALGLTGVAHADGLRPSEARSIDLGAVSGVAYYTVEPDGFRVVATLAEGLDGTPMRVTGTLAADQSLIVSVPRPDGFAAVEIEFRRSEDTLVVGEQALVMN